MSRKVYVTDDMGKDEAILAVMDEDPTAAERWPWFIACFDDWGRSTANPRILAGGVFALMRHITPDVISATLKLYAKHGLIHLYAAGGRDFMYIDPETWYRYQTHIHAEKRGLADDPKKGSKCPPPPARDSASIKESSAEARETPRDPAEIHASPSTLPPSPSPSPSPSGSPNGESAPATPVRPFSPVPKPTKDRKPLPRAVQIANAILHMQLDEFERGEVVNAVGDDEDSLTKWEACCKEWRARRHRSQIRGPLDWFADGIPPGKPERNGAMPAPGPIKRQPLPDNLPNFGPEGLRAAPREIRQRGGTPTKLTDLLPKSVPA